MRPIATSVPWLLLTLAECLISAAPIQPKAHYPTLSTLPTATPFTSPTLSPSPTPTPSQPFIHATGIPLVPRADGDSATPIPTLFSHLLVPPPHHTTINLFPPRPTIPLVFSFSPSNRDGPPPPPDRDDDHIAPRPPPSSPMTVLPETPVVPVPGAQPFSNPNGVATGSDAPSTSVANMKALSQDSPTDLLPSMEQVLEACLAARSPTLPDAFPPEVGVVRLFSQSLYEGETIALAGCGCVDLKTPFPLHSFVGSNNHSFSFYDGKGCSGTPYHQRFRQYFNVQGDRMTRSIRITQGVLPPLPPIVRSSGRK